jgi:hypothetical protein
VAGAALSPGLRFAARATLAFLHDVGVVGLAWLGAYWLRFNLEMPPRLYWDTRSRRRPWIAAHSVVFWQVGLYRGLVPTRACRTQRIRWRSTWLRSPPWRSSRRRGPSRSSRDPLSPLVLVVGAMGCSRPLYRAGRKARCLAWCAIPARSSWCSARRCGGEKLRELAEPAMARGGHPR